ncbi:uncharacterized protein LOC101449691 [Ceratitis capitata]|uniref:uncharacterized protein LOC101449691 n=1 Tax=Ceratitis capitata TaxID=7213 RepID=UPI000329F3CB|nr:uncharacterized protein LOC101449691 [Ceratitis capitata]
MNLIELPDCMLMVIYEYLTYEEVSKNRLVCRRINLVCQQVLNGGFSRAVRQHTTIFKRIKSMLPRRESERRNHSLARHADILTSIETRISMLSMTYSKYIDLNLCCFIPGRVLDEIFRILLLVSKSRKTLRPHEVLQELRDISSMAIEHFDEKIATQLKAFIDAGCSRSHVGGIDGKRITPSSSGLGSISFSVQQGSSNMWSQAGSGPKIWTPPNRASSLKLTCNNCNEFACEGVLNRVSAVVHPKCPHSESSGLAEGDLVQPAGGRSSMSANDETKQSNIPQHHHTFGCLEAKVSMEKYKKLENEYKNGVQRMNRMQQIQAQQSRRLQQTMNTISTMSTQITELKKRLEDLDAKNREISANIKQINPAGSESTTTTATSPIVTSQDSDNVEHDCDTDAGEGPSSAKKRRFDTDSTVRSRKLETDEYLE